MKKDYLIKTVDGDKIKNGDMYKIYESGEKWFWYKTPAKKEVVYTCHVKSGREINVFPRKEGGKILITEEKTGLNIKPWYISGNTFKTVLSNICDAMPNIIDAIERVYAAEDIR